MLKEMKHVNITVDGNNYDPRLCQWFWTSIRARWKRLALVGTGMLVIITVALNSALIESVQTIRMWPEPPLNFSLLTDNYPSSLEFLRFYDAYWTQYNATSFNENQTDTNSCPENEDYLPNPNITRVEVSFESLSFEDLAVAHEKVHSGGHYYPSNCTAKYRTAIIIPYRNREAHLRSFLNNIHPFLQRQRLEYAVFVVEQKSGTMFNRGMLMNIGFVEARKLYEWQCYVFHDVDLIPEDIRNYYTCPAGPRHLSAAVDKFNYKLLYSTLFGGATVLRKADVIKTNGFSNMFWGWGGEDDDFYERTRYAKLKVVRYPLDIARYKMLSHKPDKENPVNPRRYALIKTGKKRYKHDGINSLKYDLIRMEAKRLFTWIYVDVKTFPT